ncbi:PREDICTED: pentatricopeptide repeat-containing protein At2g13600-like [Nicotiana attenuata]|uniref:pentatricopeptide repeat-containing protein At2g13600-like n=1 Tax=Nicotiana attenuata TaxID=49451 RepID=UPI000905CCA9|nr:PREDICTED: pentatricopeptide repeat-containing protein At2g13600-like [Nicotiana attenuata]
MQTQCGNGFLIDEFTVVSVVNTYAGLGALSLLRELHGLATVIGVRFNLVVCNALINAYGKCGKPGYSYFIFCQMRETDVFSWTSLLVAYIRASRTADACSLFDHMPIRNVVAWTALITGFIQNGEGDKALCTFKEMLEEGIVPRASTYVGVLSSCADIPLIEKVNALVDMYSKCGDMISAMRLFERLDGKDRVTWNSIINGFAQNGNGVMSLFMFEKMIETDTTPNHVTFLGVLSACSHCGLLPEGFQYLHSMERKYGIVPQLDHYAILIDLLGRKNMLGEAAD